MDDTLPPFRKWTPLAIPSPFYTFLACVSAFACLAYFPKSRERKKEEKKRERGNKGRTEKKRREKERHERGKKSGTKKKRKERNRLSLFCGKRRHDAQLIPSETPSSPHRLRRPCYHSDPKRSKKTTPKSETDSFPSLFPPIWKGVKRGEERETVRFPRYLARRRRRRREEDIGAEISRRNWGRLLSTHPFPPKKGHTLGNWKHEA